MKKQKELEEMTATEAILKTIKELAEKCSTLDEFKKALEEIIKS